MAQDQTRRRRVQDGVDRWGLDVFIERCTGVIAGSIDTQLVLLLGGTSAPAVLTGREGGLEGRWPRTWALRAFLYAWLPHAEAAVIDAASDPEWRVREMVAKVIAAQRLTSPESEVAADALAEDDHPRVRAAALRALSRHPHITCEVNSSTTCACEKTGVAL